MSKAQGRVALTSQTAPGMRTPSEVSYALSPARSSSRVRSTPSRLKRTGPWLRMNSAVSAASQP